MGWIEVGTRLSSIGTCDAHITRGLPLTCKWGETISIIAVYRRGVCTELPIAPMVWEWYKKEDNSWQPLYSWTPDKVYKGYIYTRPALTNCCGAKIRVSYFGAEKIFTMPSVSEPPSPEKYTASFTVKDINSRVLQDATCFVGSRSCITNASGQCSISNIEEGNYHVWMVKSGYHCERDDCDLLFTDKCVEGCV